MTAAIYKKNNSGKTEHNADLKRICLGNASNQKLPGGLPENNRQRGKKCDKHIPQEKQ